MKFKVDHLFLGHWLLAITVVTASSRIPAQETNTAPPKPPAVRKVQVTSPVEYLRELLEKSPEERERILATESSERRKVLVSKIEEYEAMSPEERELRLSMTQLRWYLIPLMKSAPDERNELLASIPAEDRPLIERRLRMWDQIPVQVQKEFLENEIHLGYLLKWTGSSAEQRKKMLEQFPAHRREKLERELAQWNLLPEERREEITGRFNQFFDLDEREKARILSKASLPERQQVVKALKSLEHLPADERKRYIEAYNRFAEMSPEERTQFLRNAERWQSMTPAEQQAWRALVQRTLPPPPPPPLPPGVLRTPPLPPAPVLKTNTIR